MDIGSDGTLSVPTTYGRAVNLTGFGGVNTVKMGLSGAGQSFCEAKIGGPAVAARAYSTLQTHASESYLFAAGPLACAAGLCGKSAKLCAGDATHWRRVAIDEIQEQKKFLCRSE